MSSWGQATATTAGAQLLPSNLRRLGVMIKSRITNTDTVFLDFLDGTTSQTALVAAGMPLEPGDSIFFGTSVPIVSAPEWTGIITMAANSGNQDIRFIDF